MDLKNQVAGLTSELDQIHGELENANATDLIVVHNDKTDVKVKPLVLVWPCNASSASAASELSRVAVLNATAQFSAMRQNLLTLKMILSGVS